ncbi:hypothetical protein DH2020_042801 [Rehmannia glutinosa]|uniref:RING-type E3 ubiquitin transferase n=1 Tax=Rehmannia glutinosa TaxID=99300 RepID=A0ABR0ULX2_REHGL
MRIGDYAEEDETVILLGNTTFMPRDGGLSEKLIGKCLKTRKSCPEDKDEAKICAVCLDELGGHQEESSDENIGMLDCRHEFHAGCIKKWLRKKNICPLCRHEKGFKIEVFELNAMYESSTLCGFGAVDELVGSCFTTGEAAKIGRLEGNTVVDVFGFGFETADSLLTRINKRCAEANKLTMAVSSGVCCARGLFTTVDAADLTYDGF